MNLNKKTDQKTALKLINKYAESHNNLKEETKNLQKEIQDLKNSLKINKDIIKNLLSASKDDEKSKTAFTGLQEEIKILQQSNSKLQKEKTELLAKIGYCSDMINEKKDTEKIENDKLKREIFLLENKITMLESLNKKLVQDKKENNKDSYAQIKETYIVDPSTAVNMIHNDIISYENLVEGLQNNIKELQTKSKRYEEIIEKQHVELIKLRQNMNLEDEFPLDYKQIYYKDDEKVIILSTDLRAKASLNYSIQTISDEAKNNLDSSMSQKFSPKVKMENNHEELKKFVPNLNLSTINSNNNRSEVIEKQEKPKKEIQFADVLYEILGSNKELKQIIDDVDLTDNELKKLIFNKNVFKLLKVFEIILKRIGERDNKIKEQESELARLNEKLDKKTKEYIEKIRNLENTKGKSDRGNDSMIVNNISFVQTENNIINHFNDSWRDERLTESNIGEYNLKTEVSENSNKMNASLKIPDKPRQEKSFRNLSQRKLQLVQSGSVDKNENRQDHKNLSYKFNMVKIKGSRDFQLKNILNDEKNKY